MNWVSLGGSVLPGTGKDEAVRTGKELDSEWSRKNINAAFTDDSFAQNGPIAIHNYYVHIRMQVQTSRFVVFGSDHQPLEEYFHNTDIFKHWFMVKLSIDRDSANSIIGELREMGVTRSTLFPDLEGLAMDLSEKYIIEKRC